MDRASTQTASGAPYKLFLTVSEAADAMRIDPRTIYRAIHDNSFPAVRIRGRYIVPTRVLDQLAGEALAAGPASTSPTTASRGDHPKKPSSPGSS